MNYEVAKHNRYCRMGEEIIPLLTSTGDIVWCHKVIGIESEFEWIALTDLDTLKLIKRRKEEREF
jgi:hypothetical protein